MTSEENKEFVLTFIGRRLTLASTSMMKKECPYCNCTDWEAKLKMPDEYNITSCIFTCKSCGGNISLSWDEPVIHSIAFEPPLTPEEKEHEAAKKRDEELAEAFIRAWKKIRSGGNE